MIKVIAFVIFTISITLITTGCAFSQTVKKLPMLKNPHIVIKKKARTLSIFDDGKFVKTYKIVLGASPNGDKEIEGDGKTPEGDFRVDRKNEKSSFYLSLGLNYPNVKDAKRGLREKLITQAEHDAILQAIESKQVPPQKTALGGEIFIHGGGTEDDWTQGCAALENEEIKEIFDAISIGTTVTIEP
ncbi:MAG: L,D-transpeptidase family protein [Pyrinomonadaceae bacterium]|nr:L,D-transpeptidase family protein [Pyrinomonadaceae bacterium]